ncbi:MAG: hypothetical protein PHV82_01715 [Victivallaceae bacterium]|nr:hypothetical protein [Victivallaceae bacterium]
MLTFKTVKIPVLHISQLKQEFVPERDRRRFSKAAGDFSHKRDKTVSPYGCTGAANIYAEMGFDFDGWECRRKWAERINSFQNADGSFISPSGTEHAAATAISALNLLGFSPGRPVRNLAPIRNEKLLDWLEKLDWKGTHKDFCSAVAPVLASWVCDADWLDSLRNYVDGLVSPEKPLELWCSSDDPPWRVISCIYHITSGYDAAFLPYPYPGLLWKRLIDLNYENLRDKVSRTICTDFDFIHILYRLVHQLPERFEEFLAICRVLFLKRYAEWFERREELFNECSTHDLFCYLIGWAVLQRVIPEQFTGPCIYDTQNSPWLYRLPSEDYFY